MTHCFTGCAGMETWLAMMHGSGMEIYQQTVNPSSFIASPVAADGKIYMVSEYGELYIVQSGPEYKLLKKISLGELSLVTPGYCARNVGV